MKPKALLRRMAVLVATLMCALGASAAEAYACYTSSNTTLTFYYDSQRSSRAGETFSLNTGSNSPAWHYDNLIENVSKVVFHSSFAKARPTTTYGWFSNMKDLESITGLSYLNTSAVTNMSYMFSECNLSGSLDLSGFNTAQVTDMTSMFNSFYSASNLLNLSSFNTGNVTKMDYMFATSGFNTILVSDGWTTENVVSGNGMFTWCANLVGGQGTAYSLGRDGIQYAHIDGGESNPGYFTSVQDYNSKPYAVLTIEGQGLGSIQVLTFYNDHQRLSHSEITYGIEIINISNMFTDYAGPEWYVPDDDEYSNINRVVFDSSFASARPESTMNWFAGMRFLYEISGIEYLNTSEVTNMAYMFEGCSSLTALDVSHFNTSKVTTMERMFNGCEQLSQLDVSQFNTSRVTTMERMFYGCQRLSQLDLSLFNTSSVTTMERMFYGCESLTRLDVSHFATGNVTEMSGMFAHCKSLKSIDVSSFDTQEVTSMTTMFFYCQSLSTLDLSSFNTAEVNDMSQMFQGCTSLKTIFVSDLWSTAGLRVTGSGMFSDCTSLVGGKGTAYASSHRDEDYAHIDGGTNNPGYLTDVNDLKPYVALSNGTMTFYHDGKRGMHSEHTYFLNEPGQSVGWTTYCNTVSKVVFDPSFADVRPITMRYWFDSMSYLTSIIGLENLNTSEVTDMYYLFNACSSLKSLDLRSFDTRNVTDMSFMFRNCSSLEQIDLTGFDTRKVTDMRGMFQACSSLTSLDLSSFNTSNVTNMMLMFRNCSKLATIYTRTRWNVQNVTSSGSMFYNCTSLKGGQGTTWSSSNPMDKTYAHIDGGPSDPGYFTYSATGIATSIEAVPDKAASVQGIYTLDGRQLDELPTKKGVYIVGGKKVVVK